MWELVLLLSQTHKYYREKEQKKQYFYIIYIFQTGVVYMTCIKCGLIIDTPETSCPRCGNLLPKEEILRDNIEAGSLDAWSEEAAVEYVPARNNMITVPFLSDFLKEHPSALTYIGALSLRIVWYIIGLIIMAFSEFSLWQGMGFILNLFFATLALAIIALPPENEDFYWLKPIGSIIIVADCGITWLLLLAPLAIKFIEFLITPFA
jgi:hypothetical protein